MLFVLMIGVSLAVMAAGCSQSSGDEGQTAVAKEGTTVGETTAGERGTAQRTSGGEPKTTHDRQEIIRKQEQRDGQGTAQVGGSSSAERDGDRPITVRVTGTEGLSFVGRIGSTRDLRRVEGSVPEEYTLPTKLGAVTVSIRKQQRGVGTLEVEIIRGGQVVASKKASNPMGLVNAVWSSRKPDTEGG